MLSHSRYFEPVSKTEIAFKAVWADKSDEFTDLIGIGFISIGKSGGIADEQRSACAPVKTAEIIFHAVSICICSYPVRAAALGQNELIGRIYPSYHALSQRRTPVSHYHGKFQAGIRITELCGA